MSDLIPLEQIESKILLIRGQKVLLDHDLAELYGVATKALKRQVRRNIDRFPDDFMFEITSVEVESLRRQFGTLEKGKHSKYLPFAFTEQGIAMLSSVINSKQAILVNITIMRTFVKMRHLGKVNIEIESAFEEIRQKLDCHDEDIGTLFEMLQMLFISSKPHPKKSNKKIGFHS